MSESSPKAGKVSNFGTQNARAASDFGKAVKTGVSDLAHPSGPVRAVPPRLASPRPTLRLIGSLD